MGFISELIGIPLGWIMRLIYSVCKNYALSLLIFTVIMRLVIFPLSVKQQKSVAAMSAINPKLERLKKQYANNPNKLQEEQMKLYAEENINPMASCLPMILQLVFLYGVFDVVYRPLTHIVGLGKNTVETLKNAVSTLFEGNSYFRSRPEIYIIQTANDNPGIFNGVEGVTADMIQKIGDFDNKLFGLVDIGALPKSVFGGETVWDASAVALLLIPVFSGLIQLIMTLYSTAKQKKLNPDSAAQMGSMNMMMYMFPIMSVWMAYSFPAAIGYYWICSSLVGLAQSVVLNKVYTPEYVAKLVEKDKLKNKNKKRSAFMEKYNEMLKEQLEQQSGGGNKSKISSSPLMTDPETGEEIKMSKAQMKEYERKIIAEARRRQAEKYGDEYSEDD